MSEPARYWFHILAQSGEDARLRHAARLAEKAWHEGDRVGIYCDDDPLAAALDDLLWSYRPDAFLPHDWLNSNDQQPASPVAILQCQPSEQDWDTLIVLASVLPASADRFARLALVASNDAEVLDQARRHFRQLRDLGVTPQVHDQRRR